MFDGDSVLVTAGTKFELLTIGRNVVLCGGRVPTVRIVIGGPKVEELKFSGCKAVPISDIKTK